MTVNGPDSLVAAFFFEQSRRLDYEVTTLARESSVENLEHMVKQILVPLANELHEPAPMQPAEVSFQHFWRTRFVSCLTGEGRTDTGFRRPLAHELCSHIAFWDQFTTQITKLWIVLQCSSKSVADNNDLHDLQLLRAVKKFTAECVIHLNTTGSQDPANHLWVEHSASRLSISPEHRQGTKESARNGEFFGEGGWSCN